MRAISPFLGITAAMMAITTIIQGIIITLGIITTIIALEDTTIEAIIQARTRQVSPAHAEARRAR